MRKRDLAIRVATSLLFLVVLALYLDRPDLGTIVGVVGCGFVAAALWWTPRRALEGWQLVAVLIGLPMAMLVKIAHESTAKQLVGTALFGNHVALAGIGIFAAVFAGVLSLTLLASPRRARAS